MARTGQARSAAAPSSARHREPNTALPKNPVRSPAAGRKKIMAAAALAEQMAGGLSVADYTNPTPSAAAASSSDVFRTLFVYGPLMADEVLQTLLGRVPKHRPATLNGWVRCCKRGAEQLPGVCSTHRGLVAASYPAAVKTDDHSHEIEGLLLERLRPQELRCLDHCARQP